MTIKQVFPFPINKPPSSRPKFGVFVLFAARIVLILGFTGRAALFGLLGGIPILLLIVVGIIEPNYDENSQSLKYGWLIMLETVLLTLVILGYLLEPVGKRLLSYGRKLCAKDALQVLQQDGRRPVLFLRSFSDDDIDDPTHNNPFEWKRHRYEERLAHALDKIGPVVCLGRPGEPLCEAGACRIYVDDEYWQKAISHFLESASAIVVVVGESDGLCWEIETALSTARLKKILFFFPYVANLTNRKTLPKRFIEWASPSLIPTKEIYYAMTDGKQSRYKAFRDRYNYLVNCQLPLDLDQEQFVYFSNEGVPKLLPSHRPILSALAKHWQKQYMMHINFSRTLRAFFMNLS